MKIFVASCFFPPVANSETIVTFKLLSNSKHNYDVCCTDYDDPNDIWRYNKPLNLQAKNINVCPVKASGIDEWVDACADEFFKNYEKKHYDAFMTRSMPHQSILVAQKIKERMPNVPWIASLSDPIAKSPYDLKWLIYDNPELTEDVKKLFHASLPFGVDGWKDHPCAGIREMVKKKEIEDFAINNADALIFPLDTLKNYVLCGKEKQNAITVPHCFDKKLAPKPDVSLKSRNNVELTFLGLSDAIRTLEPLVRAMHELKKRDEEVFSKLHMRFVGNINEEVRTQIFNYSLHNSIVIEKSVDYLTSLKIMQETDWLIHIDANFPFLDEPGHSVFFAGKLADYFGTDKPILGITGDYSPAYSMINDAGGVCCENSEVNKLSEILRSIANGKISPKIDAKFRSKFSADVVAKKYDKQIEQIIPSSSTTFKRPFWPEHRKSTKSSDKFLSICVPAYNVEGTLDRCLLSIASSKFLDNLEVIVVNDGSNDSTLTIAEAYQKHYPNSFKIINKENGGHGSTINAALEVATGEYFRVIDSDDWIDTKEFDTMFANLQNEEQLADLIYTNYHEVDATTSRETGRLKISILDHYHVYSFEDTDLSMEYFTMGAIMLKTSILWEANFKLQEHCSYVDVEFFLFPIPFVKTAMFTPEFVYKYSIGNEGQTVNRDSFVRKFDQHTKVVKRVVEYYHANKEKCNFNQRTYMKNRIVDGILFAQYTICIMWEPNMEKGYANAREFDEFLKTTDKELYNSFGEKYIAIAQLRELDFNSSVYGRIPDLNFNIDAAINPPRDTRSLPRKAASRVKRAIVSRKN